MNGRVLPFEQRGHRDFERLLPWYANGTLEPSEFARVHRHLDECATCREEVAELIATMQLRAPPAADEASAVDAGWHRMLGRLDAERRKATRPAVWRRVRTGWRTSAPWLRAALLAQAAALVVLGVAFARMQLAAAPVRDAPYRTLSGPVAHTSRDAVLVIFDARATDADVRALLAHADARIVDGPNAAGAWLVATPPGDAVRVRDALRASPHVAMAELLGLPASDRR